MQPLNAIRLAKQLADEALEEEGARGEGVESAAAPVTGPAEAQGLQTPPFLHEHEVTQALRVVALLASGRNPFQVEGGNRLNASQQEEVLQSLAIVVCTLAESHAPTPDSESSGVIEPLVDGVDPALKRPLKEYLKRVEKQAIIEALEETRYNRTQAAKLLGLTFRALRYRIEALGIDD